MSVQINKFGRIDGSRTTVYHVMDYYKKNTPPDEIVKWLPLTLEQVRAAIDFIDANKADVLLHYQKMLARCEKGGPPEIEERINRKKAIMRTSYC
ncbi:MAG TPA: DUF433 domain-containing protein [Planctomycetota bacterium]|nr:DUF433 domain-containing protein [Planctomycetota bacterium]